MSRAVSWAQGETCPPEKTPPKIGPATADADHVTLRAWDHFAFVRGGTISVVIVQTELTIPPPPTPARPRARMSQSMSWEGKEA